LADVMDLTIQLGIFPYYYRVTQKKSGMEKVIHFLNRRYAQHMTIYLPLIL